MRVAGKSGERGTAVSMDCMEEESIFNKKKSLNPRKYSKLCKHRRYFCRVVLVVVISKSNGYSTPTFSFPCFFLWGLFCCCFSVNNYMAEKMLRSKTSLITF